MSRWISSTACSAPRGRALLRRLVDLVCGLLILGLAWRVCIKAGKIAGYGDTTDVLHILVGPFVYFMALMVAVTGDRPSHQGGAAGQG